MNIYSLLFILLFQFPFVLPITDSHQTLNENKPGLENIVFKSTDGGQTWQDISEGLPENLQSEGVKRDGFFATDGGLYVRAGNSIYHNKPNARLHFGKKRFPLTIKAALLLVRMGYLLTIMMVQFYKK